MAEFIDDEGWVFEDVNAVHGEWMKAFRLMVSARDVVKLNRSVIQLLNSKFIRFWKKRDYKKTNKLHQVRDSRGNFKFNKFDRVGSINSHGRAYSAMEQADLLLLFWETYKITRNNDHRRLAVAAGEVLTDDYNKGGLKLGKGWFAAQTSRDQKDIGMTLNKHMMAVRNLYVVGREMGVIEFRNAGIKGAQVTAGGDGFNNKDPVPNIYDYVPRRAGKIVFPTWAYYGLKRKGDGYFLNVNDWKNANYHIYVMRLIQKIMVEMGNDFPMTRWQSTSELGGISILKWLGNAYQEKLRRGAHLTHSTTLPGNFSAINRERTDLLTSQQLAPFL